MTNENLNMDLPVPDQEKILRDLEKTLGPGTAEILRRNSGPENKHPSKHKGFQVTPLMRAEAKGLERQIPEKDR